MNRKAFLCQGSPLLRGSTACVILFCHALIADPGGGLSLISVKKRNLLSRHYVGYRDLPCADNLAELIVIVVNNFSTSEIIV